MNNNVKNIINYFKKNNISIDIIELEKTAKTAKNAADSLNVNVGSIVKSLIFKIEDDKYIICLVSGINFVSIEKLSKKTNSKIYKPDANEVKKISGFSIGGVPPIAHKTKMETFIDKDLANYITLYAAAGHPYYIFKTNFDQLCKITKGVVLDISNI